MHVKTGVLIVAYSVTFQEHAAENLAANRKFFLAVVTNISVGLVYCKVASIVKKRSLIDRNQHNLFY